MVEAILYHVGPGVGSMHISFGCTWSNITLKVLETTHTIPATVAEMGMNLVEEYSQGLVSSHDQHNLTAVKNYLEALPVRLWNECAINYPN